MACRGGINEISVASKAPCIYGLIYVPFDILVPIPLFLWLFFFLFYCGLGHYGIPCMLKLAQLDFEIVFFLYTGMPMYFALDFYKQSRVFGRRRRLAANKL